MRKLLAALLALLLFCLPAEAMNVSVVGQFLALTGGVLTGSTTVNLNTAAPSLGPATTIMQLNGANSTNPQLVMDAYAGIPILKCRRADGTGASPSAVQSLELMCQVGAAGYGATGFSSSARASVNFYTSQIWTDSAQGTRVELVTTKNGTVVASSTLQLDGLGHVLVGLAAVPAITVCGTSPSTARGTDFGGEVTEGSTATGCVITFANAYTAAPFCVVGLQTQQLAFAYTISTTAITVTNTSATGDKINWICNGQ